MNHLRLVVLLILTSILLPILSVPQSCAETIIEGGNVSGRWTVEGSPFFVMDDITIQPGDTLLIDPGVTVQFPPTQEEATRIYLLGSLFASGTEQDSIRFVANNGSFYGVTAARDDSGMKLRFEYCTVDTFTRGIDFNFCDPEYTALRHCRIVTDGTFLSTDHSTDTLEYNALISLDTENEGWVNLDYGSNHFVHDNTGFFRFEIYIMAGEIEVYHNQCTGGSFEVCTIYLHDNTFLSNVHIDRSTVSFIENNQFLVIDVSECARGMIFRNNRMQRADFSDMGILTISHNTFEDYYSWYCLDVGHCNGVTISNNTFLSPTCIKGRIDDPPYEVYNNTFVFSEDCLRGHPPQTVFENNIVVGDGNCIGFDYQTNPNVINYNLFYNVDEIIQNSEIRPENNLYADPLLCEGVPFDLHPRADSPCINAGNPNSPLDPDDTRADMGALFFDNRIDNPPLSLIHI